MKFSKYLTLFICLLFLVAPLAMATKTPVSQDSEAPLSGTLIDALNFVNAGILVTDTLELISSGGIYGLDNDSILVPIVIRAADGLAEKPVIQPIPERVYRKDLFLIRNDLTLEGIIFDGTIMGTTELDSIYRLFKIEKTEEVGVPNIEPDFKIYNCHFKNVYGIGKPDDVEGKFIEIASAASAGVIDVYGCTFENFGDEIFNASNAYKPEHKVTPAHKGHFSEFTCKNSTFINVDGSCIKLNGDADSTTVDGVVTLENLTFWFCQRRVIWCRDLMNQTVRNIIIANSKLGHEVFAGADELIRVEMTGSSISCVDTFNIEGVKADGDTVRIADNPFVADGGTYTHAKIKATLDAATIYGYDPMFFDPDNGDFTLASASPVLTLGHDGGPLGDRRWAGVIEEVKNESSLIPKHFFLSQNYPNPFNATTTIKFALKEPGLTTLRIYDVLGHEVATLISERMDAGNYEVTLGDQYIASGVYIYQLMSGSFVSTKKMILMK